ncbi:hypothetical protein ABIC65_001532 [Sphingomonas trueperi]|uniref:chromate resistance protein ChrB domain-containing protein n=1 Tax=Sphingomonas trueperi TaxID=53317 RepID=UPI00339AE02B
MTTAAALPQPRRPFSAATESQPSYWKAASRRGSRGGSPTVSLAHLPPRHADGRTWWVTRARPKIDRIACPWLIRRFVDPDARFLFAAPADVFRVAAESGAEPFDIADERVFWSNRRERCTFDVMVEAFCLDGPAPLEAGIAVYDALYRRFRDAQAERHKPARARAGAGMTATAARAASYPPPGRSR